MKTFSYNFNILANPYSDEVYKFEVKVIFIKPSEDVTKMEAIIKTTEVPKDRTSYAETYTLCLVNENIKSRKNNVELLRKTLTDILNNAQKWINNLEMDEYITILQEFGYKQIQSQ